MRNRQSKIKKKEIQNSINNLVEAATRLSIALQDSSEEDEASINTVITDTLILTDPIVTVATKVEKAYLKEETIKSTQIPSNLAKATKVEKVYLKEETTKSPQIPSNLAKSTQSISRSEKEKSRKSQCASSHHKSQVRPGPFQKGDRLIITNNYLKKKATEGTCISSQGAYTVIRDDSGELHRRIHTNLNRVVTSVSFQNETSQK